MVLIHLYDLGGVVLQFSFENLFNVPYLWSSVTISPLQFVRQGCVPIRVFVAAATVPTGPPAQRAPVQGPIMPSAPWESDWLPSVLS